MIKEHEIIELINYIKDNLWLGDYQKAKELINGLRENIDFEGYMTSLDEARSSFIKLKEELEETSKLKDKLVISDRFKQMTRERELSRKAIVGLLMSELEKLSKGLLVIGPSSEIIRRDTYRYKLYEYPPNKYEIRALTDEKLKYDAQGLIENLEEKGYKLLPIGKERYMYILAFSLESYIEIVALPPKLVIEISLLTPNNEKAQELGELILDFLSRGRV
jgi:hypothetical protein